MKYYNQNNYANVPYPRPSDKAATVKSGGCGVCCASHIIEGLTGDNFPPNLAAQFSINCGARADCGTDMGKLSKSIALHFNLKIQTTNDKKQLLEHLASGGLAIANVGGDRCGYTGVFSDSGHFITVIGCSGNKVKIYDSGYYKGKFNKKGRSGKVTVVGNECHCSIDVLDKDCGNRNPRYYLFKKEEKEVQKQIKIKLNDVVKTVTAIEANGYNFVKLQDLRDSKIDVCYDDKCKMAVIQAK